MNDDTAITKADLSAALQQLTEQIRGHLDERLKTTEKRLTDYIDERTHDAETRLLRAFSDYQQAQTIRFARLKADVGNIDASTDQRLTAIEERLTLVDKRLIEKGI